MSFINKYWIRTLLGILFISVICLSVWARRYLFPSRYVDVKVSYGCGESYPIKLTITNNSSAELSHIIIYLQAYKPGTSTNVLENQMPIDYDYYIKPGQTQETCWSVPGIPNADASWQYDTSVFKASTR